MVIEGIPKMKPSGKSWNSKWKVLLLVLLNVNNATADIFYHHKLKKFITAVAFARALGRRPTILPIPIPIPIPIAQNEVIKIPAGGGAAKTMVIGGAGGSKDASGIAHLLNGASSTSNLGSGFTGSSSYGYQLPGISNPNVINLSSLGGMSASESNVINLAALANNANSGGSKILILGANGNNLNGLSNGGGPSIIHLGNSGNGLSGGGMNGLNFGMNSLGPTFTDLNGMNFGEMQGGFGMAPSSIFKVPQNVYRDKHRRRIPPRFQGRRMRTSSEESNRGFLPPSNSQQGSHNNDPKNFSGHAPGNVQRPSDEKFKKPIPVGEKYGYKP